LLVEALAERVVKLSQLLAIVTGKFFKRRPKAKWLVASHNRPDIEERLRSDGSPDKDQPRTDLYPRLNDSRVHELATLKKYDVKLKRGDKEPTLREGSGDFSLVGFWLTQGLETYHLR
jgi:hypothetical protein